MAQAVREAPRRVTIYLDYQATTPMAPEVAAAMRPWIEEKFANPHSAHSLGREAKAAVEVAREEIVKTLLDGVPAVEDSNAELPWMRGSPPWDAKSGSGSVYFTASATEALNWAIKGTFELASPERRRIVTVATEHAAVLDTIEWLSGRGADVVVLPVDRKGVIDSAQARAAIDKRTALVAVMYVNNEIGVIQHLGLMAAAQRAREVGARVICDDVQGFGRIPAPVPFCDMIAVSAHKIYGPKGIGALWVRNGCTPAPLLHGGGQEDGVRSGTLSPALCVGFGVAARLAREGMRDDVTHTWALYDRLRGALGPDWHVNGSRSTRWRGNLSVRRDGVDAARLISDLRDIAFSAGSACASGSGRPSHVLRAIGLSEAEARNTIRLGFGRYTTPTEVDEAAEAIVAAAARQLSFAA
jgi:cysteine desulfurase